MWQDIRFGFRTLAKSPGFTAVAVIALALGIGANATVFSMVNAILFKNLPFPDSDRVLYVATLNAKNPRGSDGVSRPDFDDLRSQSKSFAGLVAVTRERANLSDDANTPDSYTATHVASNAFSVLGQRPMIGRDFTPADEKEGADPVAILTYRLWDRRYGKDPSIVGKKIRVNAVPTTVIGISPQGLAVPPETELWVPSTIDPKQKRRDRYFTVFGKLVPGISQEAARSEVSLLGQRLATQYPDSNKDVRFLRFRCEVLREDGLAVEVVKGAVRLRREPEQLADELSLADSIPCGQIIPTNGPSL